MNDFLALKQLQSLYREIQPLNDYLLQICQPENQLVNPEDPKAYHNFLKTSYVASIEPLDASKFTKFKTGDVLSDMFEVIDRVQVRLFEQSKGKPLNILTMGYRRADHRGEQGRADMSRPAISNFFPNTNITVLNSVEWKLLLSRIGEAAMYHLLLNTSIFIALRNSSFCQLVGTPVTELKKHIFKHLRPVDRTDDGVAVRLKRSMEEFEQKQRKRKKRENVMSYAVTSSGTMAQHSNSGRGLKRGPADISFMRMRMFYARPLMVKGARLGSKCLAVGLPPNHVLNRLAPMTLQLDGSVPSEENITGRDTRHVLKHIFPRQFNLKNPFVTTQDQGTRVKLDDYTNREMEIQMKGNVKTPKRLKPALELVERLIKNHWSCNYRGLRSMACPSKLKKVKLLNQHLDSDIILEMMAESSTQTIKFTQASVDLSAGSHSSLVYSHGASAAENAVRLKPKFAEFMCSYNEVYSFIRKATKTVIPKDFWGCKKNFNRVMKHVNTLIRARRFETITLHSVLQGFSTQECDWLLPENLAARHQRPSVTDANKRRELVEEFLYWYFDSFVIPLVKTSFYVTESTAFRQQVLYFRLDDWTSLCRPLLENLVEGTFERLDAEEALEILQQRKLGFSFVRLLPKETGVRPIVNLRRKSSGIQMDGSPILSINQILQAAFHILTYEKNNQPDLLGASVFGHNGVYLKLKDFKASLLQTYGAIPKLWFVKVDVRTCFDSIEQDKLLEILQNILSEEAYMIQRYTRILPAAGKMQRTFFKNACPEAEHPDFLTYAAKLAGTLRHAIFADQVVYPYEDREDILRLLKEHVTENIVKMGQHYYRQVVGIPQGSVLSTLLCSFFYGDMENKQFKFTQAADSMLCRLVDDYLYVTADESKARKFLHTMETGHPEYGCFISVDKTLTNFDVGVGIMNRTPPGQKDFPWCGLLINMSDLSVSGDYTRYTGHIRDTLTIDRGRRPGAAFEYKMLQMTRFRSHAIFWDASLSPERVVHRNIYQGFLLVAAKMCCYVRGLRLDSTSSGTKFVIGVIQKSIRYMYKNIKAKASGGVARAHNAIFNVNELAVIWLGNYAFWTVLQRKSSEGFKLISVALESELRVAKFAKYRRRWIGMAREAGGFLERVRF